MELWLVDPKNIILKNATNFVNKTVEAFRMT